MTIRASNNPMLGLALFGVAYGATDENLPPLGTIVSGYDSENDTQNEYIFLISPASIAVGDDVDWNATTFQATEVPAGAGGAVAIVASGATQRAWFRLKRRPQAET